MSSSEAGLTKSWTQLHGAGCPVWGDEHMISPCTCPRPWRVRKARTASGSLDRYAWVISRHMEGRGYKLLLAVPTHAQAMSLVGYLARRW